MKSLKVFLIVAISLFSANVYASTSPTESIQQKGKDVVVQGMGTIKTVSMNGGTLRVEGMGSKITVKGFVDRIIIQGANVLVQADVVNYVKIEGANTLVQYKSSRNKRGIVKSDVFGANSQITKVKHFSDDD